MHLSDGEAMRGRQMKVNEGKEGIKKGPFHKHPSINFLHTKDLSTLLKTLQMAKPIKNVLGVQGMRRIHLCLCNYSP